MSKGEIFCCSGCGRDTKNTDGLCFKCNTSGRRLAERCPTEMRDRKALPTASAFAESVEEMEVVEANGGNDYFDRISHKVRDRV